MKTLNVKFNRFLHSEDGELMIQLGIFSITAAAVITSIWYLL